MTLCFLLLLLFLKLYMIVPSDHDVDYNHCGHYLYTATLLFSKIRNITADWVNLHNLWILRNCVRENYNHGIGVDDIIFGENFDGENLDTLTPLTKKRFDYLCKRIKELDPYATI